MLIKPTTALLAALLMLSSRAQSLPADVFVLTGGGQIVGELLNPDQSPRRQYVVQAADGAKITLDAAQVKQVLHPRPEELEYERIRPTFADTAAAQWELAQWCRQHQLTAQRETHLRHIIELDPNHEEARRALGYSQVDGQWVTRDEIMTRRGYQRYKGQWKLPQEIELLENKRKQETVQQEWFLKVKRWRGWLQGNREQEGRQNILSINDPAAVKALTLGLRDDSDPAARLLYIEALGKIDTGEAAKALAVASIFDPVQEVRLTCLDHLQTKKRPEVVAYYVGKLRDKDNQVVNLAAIALGRMKDPSAVGPLIDALITVHKFKISKPGGDNATSASFGGGPTGGGIGMSSGNRPTIIRQNIPNQAVLDALVVLTSQNFGFNKLAWKHWRAAQRKPPESLDTRRD